MNEQPNDTKMNVSPLSGDGGLHFHKAALNLKKVVVKTPLQLNTNLSKKYQCNVYLKREDLQVVRSYKLRGAYNMMSSLPAEQLNKGVVCASAGNHAQGFAYSCKRRGVYAGNNP
jgi:threonine dehydratase